MNEVSSYPLQEVDGLVEVLYKYMTAEGVLTCLPEVGDGTLCATQLAALNDSWHFILRARVLDKPKLDTRADTAMAENQDITLSPAEAQTYVHLGIIAANAGYQGMLFKQNRQIADGDRDPTEDVGAWYAKLVDHSEDLDELYRFRNGLLHGSAMVKPDGSVQVFDHKKQTWLDYTADEIRQYASRFYYLRFENRMTFSSSTYYLCECRAEFVQPEGLEEYEEHRKVCPVYQQKMLEISGGAPGQA